MTGKGGRRGLLDRERILDAAVVIMDGQGLQGLTMRSVGRQLGVEAMALYRYVPSRDDLLDGIVERVIDELYADPLVHLEPDGSWQEYLVRLGRGVRRMALAHPQVFPLVATRPPSAPWVRPPLRSLRWIEAFLQGLMSQGFSKHDAVYAYRAFSSFLLGHLLLEISALGVDVGPIDEPDEPATQALSQHELLRNYPTLMTLAPELSRFEFEAEFEDSLHNLLDRLGPGAAAREHQHSE